MFGAAALVFSACRLSPWCCFPTDPTSSRLRLQVQLVTPQLPQGLGLMQQSSASPWPTPKAPGALGAGRALQTLWGWIWNGHQTHRVLFVDVDLRLQDGHGRALLHSFAHTRPEVGPCEVGALVLQGTPATNRGTARG